MIPYNKPRYNNKPRVRDNVNEGIRVPEVRAVFPDGTTQVLPTQQAITKAKELNLDLIMVSPTAVPPVAKVIDHGKWVFEEKKKKNEAKKNQHVVHLKELKFSPNTDDHDYNFKRTHAIEFLKAGNKIKASVKFKGREITHAELGKALLNRLALDLKAYGNIETQPKMEGRAAFLLIGPLPQKK